MSASELKHEPRKGPAPTPTQIFVFENVEELDFVGPWEVFGMADRLYPGTFPTQLVGLEPGRIRARFGMTFEAMGSIYDPPAPRLLVIPGGPGRRAMTQNTRLLDHVKRARAGGTLLASVCTGAFVLAAAGLLDGRSATTHSSALDELREYPRVAVVKRRFVDSNEIVTAAGISAGIDMSLHLVARFLGKEAADNVADTMEYSSPAG